MDLSDPVPLCCIILLIVFFILQLFLSLFYSSFRGADIPTANLPAYRRTFLSGCVALGCGSGIALTVFIIKQEALYLPVGIILVIAYYLIYVTFAMLLPMFVGRINPGKTYRISKPGFYIVRIMLFPFLALSEAMASAIAGALGVRDALSFDEITEEDIISMVNEGHEKGVLMAQEANMIQNIFEFDDKDVKDIMVHRGDIVAIDGNENFREAIELFKESSYSRFPVYLDDLDNIIGVVHMRELLEFALEKVNFPKKIRDLDGIMRPPYFIPETQGINTLFSRMQREKSHLAIVKDEYGQTSGIISLEDIIEEIVGNIFDEHDEETEDIIDRGHGIHIMFGRTELSQVSQCLEISFDTDEIETLNGFIIYMIGRIPEEHETLSLDYKGFRFEVLDVKENIIQGVRVQRILEEEQD